MKACEQTKGMSVLDHGYLVCKYYDDLYFHLYEDTKLCYEWILPDWVYENKQLILEKLFHEYILQEYMIMHDCGKPYCRTVDEEGKVHFPNHAEVSYVKYLEHYPKYKLVAELIRSDMDIHCLKSEEVEEFAKRPTAISLLIVGLCEIHANASMFGGIDSTSFKIKWKQINKRGKQIIKNIC